jgi:hypothetical protein
VTVAVFVPEFFRDPSQVESSWGITLVWLVALLVAAPVTAYLINRRRAVATTVGRAALVGLPQLPLVVLLMVVDVWFDVRSGYLLAGSGEEAMSYGIGSVVASVFGHPAGAGRRDRPARRSTPAAGAGVMRRHLQASGP